MPDLFSDVRLPTPKKPTEEEAKPQRKPLKAAWQDFNDQRTIDDTLEGCTERLDAIDQLLEDWDSPQKKERVWTSRKP